MRQVFIPKIRAIFELIRARHYLLATNHAQTIHVNYKRGDKNSYKNLKRTTEDITRAYEKKFL